MRVHHRDAGVVMVKTRPIWESGRRTLYRHKGGVAVEGLVTLAELEALGRVVGTRTTGVVRVPVGAMVVGSRMAAARAGVFHQSPGACRALDG